MVRTDDLAAHPLATLKRRFSLLDWERIDEVLLGCVNQAGEDNRNVARMALLLAGYPSSVPGVTVNRLCASGMEAVACGRALHRCGRISLAVAGGVESMSRAPMVMPKATVGIFAQRRDLRHHAGLALRQSADGRKCTARTRWRRPGKTSPRRTASAANRKTVSRWRRSKSARPRKAAGIFAEEIEPVNVPGPKGSVKAVVRWMSILARIPPWRLWRSCPRRFAKAAL